jgi:hypothetical protein
MGLWVYYRNHHSATFDFSFNSSLAGTNTCSSGSSINVLAAKQSIVNQISSIRWTPSLGMWRARLERIQIRPLVQPDVFHLKQQDHSFQIFHKCNDTDCAVDT